VSPPAVASAVLGLVVAILLAGTLAARRRGYTIGGRTVVRCLRGHLFTTIWLPGGSLKAIRLGWWRFQWCPVGTHWTLVAPVRDSDLTDAERQLAAQHRDVRIP
jgi:hypothetical protein